VRGGGGTRGSRLVVDIYLYDVSASAARDHMALSLYDVASSTTCHRHSSALPMEPSYEREEREARTCVSVYTYARTHISRGREREKEARIRVIQIYGWDDGERWRRALDEFYK